MIWSALLIGDFRPGDMSGLELLCIDRVRSALFCRRAKAPGPAVLGDEASWGCDLKARIRPATARSAGRHLLKGIR